jgi:hypothetical protein
VKPDEAKPPAVEPGMLVGALETMGQELFAPPNVKGWPGGQSWLNTATVLARHNFTQKVSAGHLESASGDSGPFVAVPPDFDPELSAQKPAALMATAALGPLSAATVVGTIVPQPPRIQDSPAPDEHRDIAALVRREEVRDSDAIVDVLVNAILQGDIENSTRERFLTFLTDGKPAYQALDRRIRETAHAIMTMPEYQLA